MARTVILTALAALATLPPGGLAEDLVLAADGRCEYVVVVPAEPRTPEIGVWLEQSAELIQRAFAANGFEIGVASEADRAENSGPAIFLGATAFARASGVDVARLSGWSYVHKAVDGSIIIAGNDQPPPETPQRRWRQVYSQLGTVKGTADFLRKYVGTRFLWPGETGIEFLPAERVTVPRDLDVLQVPPVAYNCTGRVLHGIFYIANNMFPLSAVKHRAHSYPDAVPAAKYGESNPEYFALRGPDRKPGTHLCIANPAVQELIYQDVIHWVDKGYETVTIGQEDGFRPCQCEACRKLYGTGENWGEKLWIFHRDIARRLQEDRPAAKVMILAYTVTEKHLPETFEAFPENVIIQLCDTNPSSFEKWRDYDVPGGFAAYIYNWGNYHPNPYSPKRTPGYVERQIKRFFAHNIRGIYMDGYGEAPGLEAPTYYVYGRMLDDPENTRGEDLLNEFYTAAFGNAARPMGRFFDELYHHVALYSNLIGVRSPYWSYRTITSRGRRGREYIAGDPMRLLGATYTGDLIAELEQRLRQAEACDVHDKASRRLQLIRLEFERLKRMTTVVHLYNVHRVTNADPTLAALLDAVDEWNAQFKRYEAMKWHVAGWPELRLFKGHGTFHAGLRLSKYKADFGKTPFAWDTEKMRQTHKD